MFDQMTILQEKSEEASSTGTKIPSSISSSKASITAASGSSPTRSSASSVEAKNHILNSMISNVADRYITPEYLAPLPSAEKSGKSPLQLLAQTCSQIGADPGSNKISLEKTKEKSKAASPALIVSDNTSPSTNGTQVNPRPVSFKPYETERKKANKTPSSVVSLSPTSNNNQTASPKSPPASKPSTSSSSEATPVIRSGMEVLAGHPGASAKDLQSLGLYANPAFRPPLSSSYSSLLPPTTLAASLAAAAAGSLGSSVCRDPYCRDPTCPTAIYNAQMMASLMASGLPPGYAELLQAHKASSAASALATAAGGAGPYICNWMNGREGYCGKRHNSAEELLQHLRTHTNLSTSDSAIYSQAAAAASFQRSYGSALSASRFHPYGAAAAAHAAAAAAKNSALPSSLNLGASGLPPVAAPPAIPGAPPGLPPSLYSPSSLYASLYGARLAGSLP